MATNRYTIPHKGLKNGTHRFEFEVDDAFFSEFEGAGIKGGHASVKVDLDKGTSALLLSFAIEGEVTVECDRCLEDLSMPVHYEGELKVKFSDEARDGDGEEMWISPAESETDLAQYIYESIVLSLPYIRVHGEDPSGRSLCNEDMLARFKIVDSEEFDAMEARQAAGAFSESPEAEKLKELKDKMEKQKK
jgi:uncharacterized metal-binding protein YceD (DUF177 family)